MDDDSSELDRVRIEVVVAGHSGDAEFVRRHLQHPDASVRMLALSALDRMGVLDEDVLRSFSGDSDADVRRRVAELAAHHLAVDISNLLDDEETLVVEMAAWACGEQMQAMDDPSSADVVQTVDPAVLGRLPTVLERLVELATNHEEALVREAAVAALGAIGDERGLPAILNGCTDKPAVRRRAVLALAPFSGDEVDAALQRALADRDWQVRQAAEDVLGPAESR